MHWMRSVCRLLEEYTRVSRGTFPCWEYVDSFTSRSDFSFLNIPELIPKIDLIVVSIESLVSSISDGVDYVVAPSLPVDGLWQRRFHDKRCFVER